MNRLLKTLLIGVLAAATTLPAFAADKTLVFGIAPGPYGACHSTQVH